MYPKDLSIAEKANSQAIINAKSNSKPHATEHVIWTQGGAQKEENET